VIQIITYDHRNTAYRVLSWDLVNNYELSIYEEVSDMNNDLAFEFNVCSGIIQKMNYIHDHPFILDLENNVQFGRKMKGISRDPIESGFNNQLKLNKNFNQKKIYSDTTRYIGITKPFCLTFNFNRI